MNHLIDARHYTLLEQTNNFCVLGVRFWDVVSNAQICSGLQVQLWPKNNSRSRVNATRTLSSVYAFHRIPGLGDIEQGSSLQYSPGSLPYVMEITDTEQRYIPVAFSLFLPLPERGLFLSQVLTSPVSGLPGFYLFSTSTRRRAPNTAVIRGELINDYTGIGAAHALVRVDIPGETPFYTIADADGVFALHFPFPTMPGIVRPLASPPSGPPFNERSWQISVSVFYQPSLLPLPGTRLPDLRSIVNQKTRAGIYLDQDSPSTVVEQWIGTLDFSGEIVLRTGDLSFLAITPATSPA